MMGVWVYIIGVCVENAYIHLLVQYLNGGNIWSCNSPLESLFLKELIIVLLRRERSLKVVAISFLFFFHFDRDKYKYPVLMGTQRRGTWLRLGGSGKVPLGMFPGRVLENLFKLANPSWKGIKGRYFTKRDQHLQSGWEKEWRVWELTVAHWG